MDEGKWNRGLFWGGSPLEWMHCMDLEKVYVTIAMHYGYTLFRLSTLDIQVQVNKVTFS